MINVTFVMEQQVGHRTFYNNLRQFIDNDETVVANWVEVTYYDSVNFWEKWPFLPRGLRGTMVGRSQVKQGLRTNLGDVVFFNTQVPAALVGRRGIQRPYILCTDITPIQYDAMGEHYGHSPDKIPLIGKYKDQANRRLFQGAYHIIPWSNWVKESLIKDYGVAEEKITVIPPGVDLGIWQYHQRDHKNRPMRILFIGGDFYRKGGDVLLEAFLSLPEGMAELILVTKSSIAPLKNVHIFNNMTPNSPELTTLSQSCDIFVLPTNAEAFGIAAVEASAMGLPVIGTAVGGLVDIIEDNETGFVIKPGDVQTLTQHLSNLAQNPDLRRQLGDKARKRTEQLFDAQKNVASISQILQEAVKENIYETT